MGPKTHLFGLVLYTNPRMKVKQWIIVNIIGS